MLLLTMHIYSDFMSYDYLMPPIRAEHISQPKIEVSSELYDRHIKVWREFRQMQDEIADLRAEHNKQAPKGERRKNDQ